MTRNVEVRVIRDESMYRRPWRRTVIVAAPVEKTMHLFNSSTLEVIHALNCTITDWDWVPYAIRLALREHMKTHHPLLWRLAIDPEMIAISEQVLKMIADDPIKPA